MTRQEKEQKLLQLRAQESNAIIALNDSDYICAQITEGVEGIDAKYNNQTNYPQYGGDWKAFRATKRAQVHTIREEIKATEAVVPEEPERVEPVVEEAKTTTTKKSSKTK